jgi:hypothetical protein
MNRLSNFPQLNNPLVIWGTIFLALIAYWTVAVLAFS